MGDLLGFDGYLNESAPFLPSEYQTVWKTERRYLDFDTGTDYNETCEFPRFWNETGFPVDPYVLEQFKGCYNSEFDQVNEDISHLSSLGFSLWSIAHAVCT